MDTKKIDYYKNLEYPIEITPILKEDGGGYMATIPFLGKDAFVGDGDSKEEALRNLERIKNDLFEYYLEKGIEIPLPPKTEDYSGKFVIRVPKYLHQYLADTAKSNGVSLNTICVSLLSQKAGNARIEYMLESLLSRFEKYIFSANFPREELKGPVAYNRSWRYAPTG